MRTLLTCLLVLVAVCTLAIPALAAPAALEAGTYTSEAHGFSVALDAGEVSDAVLDSEWAGAPEDAFEWYPAAADSPLQFIAAQTNLFDFELTAEDFKLFYDTMAGEWLSDTEHFTVLDQAENEQLGDYAWSSILVRDLADEEYAMTSTDYEVFTTAEGARTYTFTVIYGEVSDAARAAARKMLATFETTGQ